MSELLFPSYGPPNISVFEGHAGRKTVLELPAVGRAELFHPPGETDELELLEIELIDRDNLGRGPDAHLVALTTAFARESGANILNVPLYDERTTWWIQAFRAVPGYQLALLERLDVRDDPDREIKYVYDDVSEAGIGWVAGELARRLKRNDWQAELEYPEIPPPYLMQILL